MSLTKSHSEYLVRNSVWSAARFSCKRCVVGIEKVSSVNCTRCAVCIVQGVHILLYKVWSVYRTRFEVCIIQGVKCVLYKVWSVYCTRCAHCTVQGVKCVSYKVCNLYRTLSWPAKSSVNKEDLILNMIYSNLIFFIVKTVDKANILGLHVFSSSCVWRGVQ